MLNKPFFSDLSTYTPEQSISFYENVFNWKYYKVDKYYTAFHKQKEVAGLYETPQKFKQMRMPHFWMTYFRVSDINEVVTKAKNLGGIIELNYETTGFGKVALIRDPQGAGFTVYEGYQLNNTRTKQEKNTLIWNELHVSKTSKIIPFYQSIFDWNIIEVSNGIYKVLNNEKEHITDILEIDNSYKGKYEYWVCTFGVESINASKELILKNGGAIITEEENRILVVDNSNEAFFYIENIK